MLNKNQELMRKFYQNEIYRLNDKVKRFVEQQETGNRDWPHKTTVWMFAFDTTNRCLNYFPVHAEKSNDENDRWYIKKSDELQNLIIFLKKEKKTEFCEFLKCFDDTSKKRSAKNLESKKPEELHYFLLELYNDFPVNPDLFIDGIMRRCLPHFIKRKQIIKYAFVDMLNDNKKNKLSKTYFSWVKMKFVSDNNNKNHKYVIADQESELFCKIDQSMYKYNSENENGSNSEKKAYNELRRWCIASDEIFIFL